MCHCLKVINVEANVYKQASKQVSKQASKPTHKQARAFALTSIKRCAEVRARVRIYSIFALQHMRILIFQCN